MFNRDDGSMIEHRLVIPAPVFQRISDMRYTDHELIDYYLAKEIDMGTYKATTPLVRMPFGQSRGLSVADDPILLAALGRYLDVDQTHAAVMLHFHPIRGPSPPDAQLMRDRYQTNNRLNRYAIFVGPNGPTFYETDGRDVFPIRSSLRTMPHTPEIAGLQDQVLTAFGELVRSRDRHPSR